MKVIHILAVVVLLFACLLGALGTFNVSAIILFYIVGITAIKILIRPNDENVYNIYGFFYGIYGLLAVWSHVELIHDPFTDYFIHNDACDSFFSQVVSECSNLRWDNLLEGTLFNPYFGDYPLPMMVFAFFVKLADGLDPYLLRFFLRIHIFMMSALLPTLLADLQYKHSFSNNIVLKRTIIFGLISYLYITSTVFTRDIYVCFFYSWMFYEILQPIQTKMPLKFIILFLLSYGSRPENGLFSLLFVFTYYIFNKREKINPYGVWVGVIMVGFVFNYLHDAFLEAVDTVNRYQIGNLHNNSGGLFGMVNSMPFPFNYIGIGIYLLLMPLPFDVYLVGKGNSWFTLPYLLSPYLMALIFGASLWYAIRYQERSRNLTLFIYTIIASFLFISQASPDIRRSFAVIPSLYMIYCLIIEEIPKYVTKLIKRVIWPLILIVGIAIYAYARM